MGPGAHNLLTSTPPHLVPRSNTAMPQPFAPAIPYGYMAVETAAPFRPPKIHKGCATCNRGYARSDKNTSLQCTRCCDAALRQGVDPWTQAGETTPEHARVQLDKRARG